MVSHTVNLPLVERRDFNAYNEVMHFLSNNPSPAQIAHFQLSAQARQRASDLLSRERTDDLTDAEAQELDFYVELGDFLGILRAKAQLELCKEDNTPYPLNFREK